ncbi:MAG: hypothetical protein IK083_03640 [Abditibacteriota bacterium]|nr:hypothetical protein [Abditibacteriota bacterium]
MMAYICDCCGREFEEPTVHTEWLEVWGKQVPWEVWGCPYCGGGYQDA